MKEFYHKKVIPFENYLSINFDYEDIDIILKSLELFCYNVKNVYLMKEDNSAIKEMLYKLSILYNLVLSSYTLHIDNELKKEEEKEKENNKAKYYKFTIDRSSKTVIKRKKVEKVG